LQLKVEMEKPGGGSEAELLASAAVTWQATYVSLLLELAAVRKLTQLRIQPEMLAFSVSGTSRLSPVTKVVALECKLQALEKEHGITTRWADGQEEFEAGLEALTCHQLERIQLKLTTFVLVSLLFLSKSEVLRHFFVNSTVAPSLGMLLQ